MRLLRHLLFTGLISFGGAMLLIVDSIIVRIIGLFLVVIGASFYGYDCGTE